MTKKSLTKHYKRNCTNCAYFEDGYCWYFELKQMKKKKVPDNIILKGCKYYSDEEPHPLLRLIVEKFKGELI